MRLRALVGQLLAIASVVAARPAGAAGLELVYFLVPEHLSVPD
jgi:hypothetical protein